MPNQSYSFQGFRSPTTTSVPDELFDQLMPVLSGAELKVLLYIVRRTFGFKKDSDRISLGQLVDGITTADGRKLDGGTGLSKAAVASAVKSLSERGVILATRRRSAERGNEATTYQLRFLIPLSRNQTRGSPKNGPGLVQKLDTQQTVKQQTEVHHQDDDVIGELRAFGIEADIASQLASAYEPAYVRDRLDRICYLVATNPTAIRKTPQAFLVAALKHPGINPAPGYKTAEQRQAEADAKAQAHIQALAAVAAEEERLKSQRAAAGERTTQALQTLRREHPSVRIPGTSLTVESAWQMALERLQNTLSRANHLALLSNTTLIVCDRSQGIVGAPSAYVAGILRRRWHQEIEQALADVLGFAVRLDYVPITDALGAVQSPGTVIPNAPGG